MAHRRVKDVEYDEEEDYDYEDDSYYDEAAPTAPAAQGMSAEDQANMREGAAAVRDVLGGAGSEGAAITTKEIEESLWYYYFDVEKTVAYLLSTSIQSFAYLSVWQKEEKMLANKRKTDSKILGPRVTAREVQDVERKQLT